jgi:hypothetical protein
VAEYKDREHYIPLRRSDLAKLLLKDKHVGVQEHEPLAQFFRLVNAVFHFEYQTQLEDLKDDYAPFDPDSDTRPLHNLEPEGRTQKMSELFDRFAALMERANFKQITEENFQRMLAETPSNWGIPTHVDVSIFDRVLVFARGDIMGERSRRLWWKLWRKETIMLPVFSRLVVILKFNPQRFRDHGVSKKAVYLKIFKDIPKMDLPMLVPGAKVRLSKVDRALIVYPLLAGIGLMGYNILSGLINQNWSAITAGVGAALASWSAALAIGGYGYKSYHSYQVKKQHYNLRLSRSLYYQTLDSNTGVLMHLMDEAEEQECRETYLAWFCLWKFAPAQGWTPEQLDDYVEMYLEGAVHLKVDFEIGDALEKLERLHLVKKCEDRFRAVPLDKALEMLDYRWDNYFKYNNPEEEALPVA